MSFMLTKDQVRARTKDVTRRNGWWHLKVGDRVRAVEKGMGLKKGERVVPLAVIEVTHVRQERLEEMLRVPRYGKQECRREGFPEMEPEEFVRMFCTTHRGVGPGSVVNRIQFEYVSEEQ